MTDLSSFTKDALALMRNEIIKVNGNEVFFVGKWGKDELIDSITPLAWGNDNSVPVIYDQSLKGDIVIHNHPSGSLNPSDNDIAIASALGNNGIGFIIINNSVTKSYTVVDSVKTIQKALLEINTLLSLFNPKGKIGTYFNPFEQRDSQLSMLKAICDSIKIKKLL